MNNHTKNWVTFILIVIGIPALIVVSVVIFKPAPDTPEAYLCDKYFKASWRSITAEEAKDIPNRGRKENTITIICEESNK